MRKFNAIIFVIVLSLSFFTSCGKDDMDRGGYSGGGLDNSIKSISDSDTSMYIQNSVDSDKPICDK